MCPKGSQPASQVIDGYSYNEGTAIALPRTEHRRIPNVSGDFEGSVEDLVQTDLQNLREFTNAPDEAIAKLETLIGDTYPEIGPNEVP